MEREQNHPDLDALDRATSERLAKLRGMPVDLVQFRHALEKRIPALRSNPATGRLWIKPMRALAASVLVAGIVIATVISSSSGPVLASADTLAQIHQEVITGASHSTPVSSFEAAKSALVDKWPGSPAMPEIPHDHVMSCCVHSVGRKKMACVTLESQGVPVTMAVADAADVKVPASQTTVVDGITYHIQSSGGINMAMTLRGGRWICLMGKVPTERLIRLAASMR